MFIECSDFKRIRYPDEAQKQLKQKEGMLLKDFMKGASMQICETCGRLASIYGVKECWNCRLSRIQGELAEAAQDSADKAQEEQEE